MKVKIITSDFTANFEKELNEFIADKTVASVTITTNQEAKHTGYRYEAIVLYDNDSDAWDSATCADHVDDAEPEIGMTGNTKCNHVRFRSMGNVKDTYCPDCGAHSVTIVGGE